MKVLTPKREKLLAKSLHKLESENLRLSQALHRTLIEKNRAYEERNRCVALLASLAVARGWTAGTARTDIEGWDPKWLGCVYIDLPAGQVSWHFHDSHAPLYAHLDQYPGEWDGHDTEEKYRRVHQEALARAIIVPARF